MGTVSMNGHQLKLWHRMLELINDYKEQRIGFASLVSELEGVMDACDFHDQELVSRWYDLWQPLEVRNAIEGSQTSRAAALDEVEALERFMKMQT